jgi:hypothetical protein
VGEVVLLTLEMALLRVGLGAVLFAPKRRFMVGSEAGRCREREGRGGEERGKRRVVCGVAAGVAVAIAAYELAGSVRVAEQSKPRLVPASYHVP